MTDEQRERFMGLIDIKDLKQLKKSYKMIVTDLTYEGFEREDVLSFIIEQLTIINER